MDNVDLLKLKEERALIAATFTKNYLVDYFDKNSVKSSMTESTVRQQSF